MSPLVNDRSAATRRLAVAALACGSMLGMSVTADAAPDARRVLAVCADPSNLPFSNDREEGFENRIASLLARDLNATVRYTWNMQRRSFLRRTLKAGACDVVIGLPAGLLGVALTRPYYASSYVFVTAPARHRMPSGFDDPALRDLRIGLQAIGAEGSNTPPAGALSRRGLVDHVVGFPMWAEEGDETPQGRIVDAVASGEIDLAIVWGPFAGYFAKRHGAALEIEPVADDPAAPGLVFRYEMSLGVRVGDEALRDELQQVLDRRQPEIDSILRQYGVPRVAPSARHDESTGVSVAQAQRR